MRYAPEQEIPLPSMQDGECARILNKTMGKIKETKQKPARPVRTVLIAAAIAALTLELRAHSLRVKKHREVLRLSRQPQSGQLNHREHCVERLAAQLKIAGTRS